MAEDHHRVLIVMELCGKTTLSQYVRDVPGRKRLQESEGRDVIKQVLSAIDMIHSLNRCHRDLKMTNILINEHKVVKVIDFGFATEASTLLHMYCGTPSYMPPEIVERKEYAGKPADIWSIGVLVYKLVVGDYPFGPEDDPDLKSRIINVDLRIPTGMSSYFKDFVSRCCRYKPTERPTI
jgi:serine/threonine protein kinase